MKKFFFVLFLSVLIFPAWSQEDETPVDKPVRDFFASTMLIDQQTVNNATEGGLELIIQHRFGKISEISDLYGIYAPSNIRMGLNYGVSERLMLGLGTEKNSKMQDIMLKYAILKQTKSGKMPVSVSYFFDFGIDARSDETFGKDYKFTNRLSYFNQIIIARKFTDALSLQVAPSYSHVNKVDSLDQNSIFGLAVSGRMKLYNEVSFMAEYNHPFYADYQKYYQKNRIPNLGFGLEFGTSTHAFQVFATTDDRLIAQKTNQSNSLDFTKGDFIFGFNITVRF